MDISKAIITAVTPSDSFGAMGQVLPHELFPLTHKPALHHILEEVVTAGLSTVMVVVGKHKHSIDSALRNGTLSKLLKKTSISCVQEQEPRGLAHALWLIRDFCIKEYIAVLSPDEIIANAHSTLNTLMRIARQEKGTVIAIRELRPDEDASQFPLISIKKQITTNLFQINTISTSHCTNSAPSRYAVLGRAILSHKIFHVLSELSAPDTATEPCYYEALNKLVHHNERVFAHKISDPHFTLATPQAWLKAFLHYAANQQSLQPTLAHFTQMYHRESPNTFTPAQEALTPATESSAKRIPRAHQ